MCLAVPARIVELHGASAVVDLHGNRVEVNTVLVPEVAIGDWVLLHAGFAIQRLSGEEAEQTFAILHDMAEAAEVKS